MRVIGLLAFVVAIFLAFIDVPHKRDSWVECGSAIFPERTTSPIMTSYQSSTNVRKSKVIGERTDNTCSHEIEQRRILIGMIGGIGTFVFLLGHKVVTFGESPKLNCSNCGARIARNSKFCSTCGVAV